MNNILYEKICKKSIHEMVKFLKINIKESNNKINILFTNIADNSKDPSKIYNLNVRKKYIKDFEIEKEYIKGLINNKRYDLILFEELYTDVLYDNINIDSIKDDIQIADYNIVSDAAMRGEKKYYFDTFYKNYTMIYNKKSLLLDACYTYNVRMSRLIKKTEKDKQLIHLKECDSCKTLDGTENIIKYKSVEIMEINKKDIKNSNFFRLSYTNISNEDHNMQHNIFQYNIKNPDNNRQYNIKLLVCNIHMINAYRYPNEGLWYKEALNLFENINLLSRDVDCV